MKYYRLVDDVLQPYYSGYNDTSLKDLAESIYDIAIAEMGELMRGGFLELMKIKK